MANHSAFGMWNTSGALVEGNTGQRQAAVADRTHHKIGGKRLTVANTDHEALRIDHGPLDLDWSRDHSR